MTSVLSRRVPRTVAWLGIALVTACGGDDDPTPPQPTPAITITVAPTTVSVTQGQSQTVTATLGRTNFTGAVGVAVTGAPAGLTVTATPASLTGTTGSTSISVAAAATTAPGTYPLTVTASGTGVTSQSATLTVTVAAATPPSVSAVLAPTSLSVQQGASATTTLTVTRAGGFAGAVDVAVEGAPTGVTATASPASIAAGSATSTITVAAGATAAVTTSPVNLTVRVSGTGITAQTVSLPVTITAAPATGSYTIAVAPTTVSVAQGGTTTSAVNITRTGGFAGAVGIAVSGAPAGLTVTPAATSVTGNSVALNVSATSALAAGSYPVTVTTTATGLPNQTATLTVTVTAAATGGFTLALSPATITLQQGQTTTATVTITRTGGFAGPVDVTVGTLPAGVTAEIVTTLAASRTSRASARDRVGGLAPAGAGAALVPIAGNTATVRLTASATAAVGSFTLTVTGTAAGLPTQTATAAVNVTAAPTTGGVGVSFCADALPLWVGYQAAEGAAWTRATVSATGVASLPLTGPRSGVAFVTQSGGGFLVNVVYGSPTELTTYGASLCQVAAAGGKTATGSVVGLGATDQATITLGGATASVIGASGSTFTLNNIPSGPRDLLATRASFSLTNPAAGFTVNRAVLRRNVNVANGGTIAPIDFGGAESFAPVTANVTIAGAGSDVAFPTVAYTTANGASGAFFSGIGALLGGTPSATQQYAGVPAAQQASGDFHMLSVIAFPGSATNLDQTNFRFAGVYFRAVADRTVTLGPSLTAPTVTLAATTPYPRPRVQLARQAEYADAMTTTFSQAGAAPRSVAMTVLASYSGGASWDVTFPDLTGAQGFDPTWALRTGVATNWTVSATGGNIATIAGGQPAEGSTFRAGARTGVLAASAASRLTRRR